MQLYADEDFPHTVVEELRQLGHDVLTAQADGRRSTPDPDILARAHALGRAVLTHNRRHFERLHRQATYRRRVQRIARTDSLPSLCVLHLPPQ